jgi:hypothetical protein
MKRAMRFRIIACLWAVLGLIAASSSASAAIWAWGCQGQLGAQQVIFNRYSLYVVEGKKPFADVHKLTADKIDDLIKGDNAEYSASNGNDGLAKEIEFERVGDAKVKPKLILTEKSSRKISGKHRLICGRDEDTDIYLKVYHYRREDEQARDITMQCIEYQLSTRGGRKGCD